MCIRRATSVKTVFARASSALCRRDRGKNCNRAYTLFLAKMRSAAGCSALVTCHLPLGHSRLGPWSPATCPLATRDLGLGHSRLGPWRLGTWPLATRDLVLGGSRLGPWRPATWPLATRDLPPGRSRFGSWPLAAWPFATRPTFFCHSRLSHSGDLRHSAVGHSGDFCHSAIGHSAGFCHLLLGYLWPLGCPWPSPSKSHFS